MSGSVVGRGGKRKGLGKKEGDCWSQVTRIRNLDGRLNVCDGLLIPLGHFDARNPRGGLALDAPHDDDYGPGAIGDLAHLRESAAGTLHRTAL